MSWPAVSSVYEECHHGWQPSCSMIYALPVATGTCREVTTCLQRSVELFQLRGVLDANRFNDGVWSLKFSSWSTMQTFGDAFQTCLSSDREAVSEKTVHSLFFTYTPVVLKVKFHGNMHLCLIAEWIFVIAENFLWSKVMLKRKYILFHPQFLILYILYI